LARRGARAGGSSLDFQIFFSTLDFCVANRSLTNSIALNTAHVLPANTPGIAISVSSSQKIAFHSDEPLPQIIS